MYLRFSELSFTILGDRDVNSILIYMWLILLAADHREEKLLHQCDDLIREWVSGSGRAIVPQVHMWWPISLGILFERLYSSISWESEEKHLNRNQIKSHPFCLWLASFCASFCMQRQSQQHPRATPPADSQGKQVVGLWDFQLRHTELVILGLRSGMQLRYSLAFMMLSNL